MKIHTYNLGAYETNAYLVETDSKNAIIIDPADKSDFLLDKIAEKGVSLDYIFLTHGHFDHILAASKLALLTGAKIYVSEADKELLSEPKKGVSFALDLLDFTPVTPDAFYKDGEEIVVDEITIKVIATPGHTKGSVMLLFTSTTAQTDDNYNGLPTLFSGDTIFRDSIGNTWGDEAKLAELLDSIKHALTILPEDCNINPGHGKPTTLKREQQYNMYINKL
ncbi:MAG: MBL fold metallo-hydrolase [Oscillospiraceae bacterium]|jgi:glyoxylase-like metal-dependent hydrolase (beta-lactamase superfamily II)|nr:MBL fold metallo-hydrolase [Oscillospiraceae bacterium]